MADEWDQYAVASAPSENWEQYAVKPTVTTKQSNVGKYLADNAVQAATTMAKSTGNMIGGLANAAMHPVDTLVGTANALTHPIDAMKGYVQGRWDSPQNAMKTLTTDPAGVILDASTLMGGAGAGLSAVGKANDMAGMAKVGQVMSDMAKAPVEGAAKAVTGSVEAISKTPGETSSRINNWLVKLPEKAYRYGKDPMSVLKDEAVTGNSITDLATNYELRLNKRVEELKGAVSKSDAQLDLTEPVKNALSNATQNANTSLRDPSILLSSLDTIKQRLLSNFPDIGNMSLSRAVDFKRQLAEDFPFSASGDAAQNALAKAAHSLHHDINAAIDKAAPEVGKLNDTVSSLIDISKAAQHRMALEARHNPFGLVSSLIGIGGAAHGGLGEGLGLAVATKVATSPAVLSRVAWGLSKLSSIDKAQLFEKMPWFADVAQKSENFTSVPTSMKLLPSPKSTLAIGFDQESLNRSKMLDDMNTAYNANQVIAPENSIKKIGYTDPHATLRSIKEDVTMESKYRNMHNKALKINEVINIPPQPTQSEINIVNSIAKTAQERTKQKRILTKYGFNEVTGKNRKK